MTQKILQHMADHMNKIIFLLPVLVLLGLLGMSARYRSNEGAFHPVLQSPPAFTLEDMQTGQDVSIKSLLGQDVVMVNFFSPRCQVCAAEHPQLMRLAQEYNLPIIGVAYKDSPEEILRFIDKLGNPYTHILLDPRDYAGSLWDVSGTPESFLIDRSGMIRYRHKGLISPQKLDTHILPALKELGGGSSI